MICFLPSNEYHTATMAAAAGCLDADHRDEVVFIDLGEKKREGASEAIRRLGLPSKPYEEEFFSALGPGDALVVMCDWSPWERDAVIDARRAGAAAIGMVEGAQDYLDTHIEHLGRGRPRYPYSTVAERLLLGEFDRKFVPGIVTGCPRLDPLIGLKPPLPARPTACVHSNFTYGLYEDVRERWIEAAVGATREAGWDYYLIAHPRDTGDFGAYKRHPGGRLLDELRDCSALITRFSSIVFDALLLGRRVIYFNPHGERQPTFLEPMGAFDFITGGRDSLRGRLLELSADPRLRSVDEAKADPRVVRFLEHHLGPLDGRAAERAGRAISMLARKYARSNERAWAE